MTIYQLGERTFPHLKTIANSNLPTPASSFLGREAELYEADSRLQETRLLTVIGPGGAGKTRFALELAIRARDERFRLRGRRLQCLPLQLARSLTGADHDRRLSRRARAARAVGGRGAQRAPRRQEAAAAARQRRAFDGSRARTLRASLRLPRPDHPCHLPGASAPEGEGVYELPPLRADESVALFCERAQTADDATRELCAQLEGLPLAIELAAARTSVLTPQQIATRLSQRLDLPQGRPRPRPAPRDAESHHRLEPRPARRGEAALRAAVRLRRRLHAGSGRGGRDADLDTLQSLVEKSLVRFTDGRYWLLETIREYAGERLNEKGAAQPKSRAGSAPRLLLRIGGPSASRPKGQSRIDQLVFLKQTSTCI